MLIYIFVITLCVTSFYIKFKKVDHRFAFKLFGSTVVSKILK